MRDYAELVEALRCCSKIDARNNGCDSCPYEYCGEDCQNLCGYAADAIEELLARDVVPTDFHERCLQLEIRKRIELEKQMPHWISVEKPPNDERNVFICHGNADFKAPCIGHYDASMKRFYEDKNWFASPIYDAMFWCEMPKLPLPTPPKGVE